MVQRAAIVAFLAGVKRFITVEPVIVFYIFGVIHSTGLKLFEYEKACATKLDVDLRVCEYFVELEDHNICDESAAEEQWMSALGRTVGNFTEFRTLVCDAKQRATDEVVFLNSYRSIIVGIVQAVVLIFAGSWSDRVGLRKPCILVPIAADIIAFGVYILSTIFMREIPLEVAGILPGLIVALSGGVPLVVTGIYSYLSMCTTESERTFRFACTAVIYATVPIVANFWSGHIYKFLGFQKLCMLCALTDAIGLTYGLFVLKEPSVTSSNEGPNEETTEAPKMAQLLDLSLLLDCFRAFFKKREFNARAILMLTVLAYLINYGSLGDIESAATLAFLKFNWITNLGTWISYDLLTTLLGTLLAMGVLSKRFGVSDAMICVISICFSLVGKPIMAYAVSAVKPYLYYVATSIDVFEGSKMIAIRSIVSKLVGTDEIGKMFSILGIMDSIQVVVYPTLYSAVYLKSKAFFEGMVFVLSEVFLLVALAVYIVLYFMSRKAEEMKTLAQTRKDGIDNPAVDVTAL